MSDEKPKDETQRDDALEAIYERTHTFLGEFLTLPTTGRIGFVQALRPKPEDLMTIFIPGAIRSAEIGYRALWGNTPTWPAPPDAEISLAGARVEHLRTRTTLSTFFPGGYVDAADFMNLGPIWFAWRFIAGRATQSFDGLVAIVSAAGEVLRYVWAPRPWKVLPRTAGPNKIYHDY